MSKRAEEEAIKAYPVVIEEHTERDLNKPRRLSYINGYEQAEKDLTLSWEDIEKIDDILIEIDRVPGVDMTRTEFFKEVLRRFKEYKNK